MSLFKHRAAETAPPPAPTQPVPAAAPNRTIDPAMYGFVPAPQVRADRAAAFPDFDVIDGLVATGNWQGISAFLSAFPPASERRLAVISRLCGAAAKEDAWLRQWLREDPKSVSALTLAAGSATTVAFQVRTTSLAKDVSQEQWDTFFRILNEVPEMCARASDIDPVDPAPWIMLQQAALGLQWNNDRYRALWREVSARAPHSFTAVTRAWNYWRPRWYGSLELVEAFVESEIAAAPLGSVLTESRLSMLFDEFRPKEAAERTAFYHSDRFNMALDHGIRDAAAADPEHAKLPYLRHWLAYQLYLAGRNAEAIEQFRWLGGFCGATPWDRFKNAAKEFTSTRATVVLRWEDAGRPAR